MAKGFGVSPITNAIYYGTQDPKKHMWTGKKEDVTDGAIAAVYEWFMSNMGDLEEYSITYPNTEFKLAMRRKQDEEDGYWIMEDLGYGAYRYKCSKCGAHFGQDMIDEFNHNKYCADCGTKMKLR